MHPQTKEELKKLKELVPNALPPGPDNNSEQVWAVCDFCLQHLKRSVQPHLEEVLDECLEEIGHVDLDTDTAYNHMLQSVMEEQLRRAKEQLENIWAGS